MSPHCTMRTGSSAVVALALAAVLASCTEKIPPPNAPPPPPPTEPMRPVTPDSVQSIFTTTCATPACHVQGFAAEDELLDADSSYIRIVNVPAGQQPGLMRIRPFQPDSSYLIRKVRGDPGIDGQQMPLLRPPLPPEVQQVLVDWVANGALADSIPADSSRLMAAPSLVRR